MTTLVKINSNGDGSSTLIAQHMEVRRAAIALLEALNNSSPHGRNYQLNSDPIADITLDTDILVGFCTGVEALSKYAMDSAVAIKKQVEG